MIAGGRDWIMGSFRPSSPAGSAGALLCPRVYFNSVVFLDLQVQTGSKTFVGFGFGAIQAGLFLHEAQRSGAFGRLVVAEVVPGVTANLRRAGRFSINVATSEGVEVVEVGPIQIENPDVESDRRRLVDAVAGADEIGTAVPSVDCYRSESAGSLHGILAEGLRRKAREGGPRAVVYAAENHNRAAEVLRAAVLEEVPESERAAVRSTVAFVNTVIGKMSGVVTDAAQIEEQKLRAVVDGDRRAFLVETFHHILISKIRFENGSEPFQRGLDAFEEKADLLPFEEAKLYGHNATHALAAFVGEAVRARYIGDLREKPGMMPFLRAAFIEESGEALVRKHRSCDPLFTHAGYREYADDLLARMTNPHLRDTVERVGRDPERKLGWDDRLVGTMRLALKQGLQPRRFALGVALALEAVEPGFLERETCPDPLLGPIWSATAGGDSVVSGEAESVLALVEEARRRHRAWRESGFGDLEMYFCREY